MGFEEAKVEKALKESAYNTELAIEALFNGNQNKNTNTTKDLLKNLTFDKSKPYNEADAIARLMAFGFTEEQATNALLIFDKDE